MSFGEKLREMRKGAGMNQRALADAVGVTPSCLSKWESGHMLPSKRNLDAICEALGITCEQLQLPNGRDARKDVGRNEVNDEEKRLIRDYRKLDDFGKRTVLLILKNEKKRAMEYKLAKQKTKHGKKPGTTARLIPYYIEPAAAGYSAEIDGAEREMIQAGKNTPMEADFAVRIQGDSMLPYLRDGEKAFVKRMEAVGIGEIGLFSVNGAQYSKMFYKTGSGDIWLISTNKDLAGSNVLIRAGSNDTVKCYGKILTDKKPQLPNYFMEQLAK